MTLTRRQFVKGAGVLLAGVGLTGLYGCANTNSTTQKVSTSITVANGTLKGTTENNGVLTWKGVPYAKAPVGNLRWKPTQAPDKSDAQIDCTQFGPVAPQFMASFNGTEPNFEISEDCLTLNIWASDITTENKAVMIYFHGGGYGWGGSANPLFNGANFVKAYPDVIMVTANYRLGMFGFIDLSSVPGGEAYSESGHLGILDQIQAIRWVKENISEFGGNPNNITVFGESAGAGSIATMLTMDLEEGLFQRAILQSGGLSLTNDQHGYDTISLTPALLEKTGCKTMEELIAISSDEMVTKYLEKFNNGYTLNQRVCMPLRDGKVIPFDGYEVIKNSAKIKNIDLMVGATKDEYNYWLEEYSTAIGSTDLASSKQSFTEILLDPHVNHSTSFMTDAQKANLEKYWNCLPSSFDHYEKYNEYINDLIFRVPTLINAADHADAGGNSYVYYFAKESTTPCLGACHSVEVAYVFDNPDQTAFAGTVDVGLAEKVSNMWANFARTGNPSIEDCTWEKYDTKTRKTLVIGNDNSLKIEEDYLGEQRKYMEDFVLNGHYWELSANICGWFTDNVSDIWADGKK